MKVKLAKNAGFCMGVKRAVELILKTAAESPGPIFTWGPLIHNPQTVEFLSEQGVGIVENFADIPESGTVVIRSHGVGPEIRRGIAESGARVCDATCPKVARVQGLIKKNAETGRDIIIIGHKHHAEVEGLLGFAGEKGYVVASVEEAEELPLNIRNPVVLGQTTLSRDWFDNIAEAIKNRFPGAEIADTLCDATTLRQNEVPELAKEVEAIVVAGGFNSSNTRRLYEIAQSTGIPSFWVETAAELNPEDFEGMETVGVTAGASTPHWIVSRVIEKLERFGEKHLPPWEWPWLKDFGYAMVQGNVLAGLAGAMLAATAFLLIGVRAGAALLVGIGAFTFGAHTIYNLVDWQNLALVDPSRIRFFWGNRKLLAAASAVALLAAIPLTWTSGIIPFVMMIVGVVFSALLAVFRKMPGFMAKRGVSTWREIPGIKDILHTAGWVFVGGILPVFAAGTEVWPSVLAILWICLLSFLRAMLFSITDAETDRVLGRESFATIFGEKRVWDISLSIAVLSAAPIIIGVITRILKPMVLAELAMVIYIIALVLYRRRSGIRRGTWAELAVDGGFIIGGIIAIGVSVL